MLFPRVAVGTLLCLSPSACYLDHDPSGVTDPPAVVEPPPEAAPREPDYGECAQIPETPPCTGLDCAQYADARSLLAIVLEELEAHGVADRYILGGAELRDGFFVQSVSRKVDWVRTAWTSVIVDAHGDDAAFRDRLAAAYCLEDVAVLSYDRVLEELTACDPRIEYQPCWGAIWAPGSELLDGTPRGVCDLVAVATTPSPTSGCAGMASGVDLETGATIYCEPVDMCDDPGDDVHGPAF